MQTLSSARRTCMASASAVECTATVAMPSSLQARRIRRAISPRLAIRILSNMVSHGANGENERIADGGVANGKRSAPSRQLPCSPPVIRFSPLLDDNQRLAEFDRLAVIDEDLGDGARARRRNLVHRLHRLDDQQGLPDRDLGADF